jgi:hypothetical protein
VGALGMALKELGLDADPCAGVTACVGALGE